MFRLITNNEALCANVIQSEYIEGSSLDVLIHVRGLVHSGSKLITHPLCGNLRPNHQPYRSIIIDYVKGSVDFDSLALIEQAISVYESCKLILPCELDESKRADYAYVDAEIMRESISQCGLMRGEGENLCASTLLPVKEVISHEIGTP